MTTIKLISVCVAALVAGCASPTQNEIIPIELPIDFSRLEQFGWPSLSRESTGCPDLSGKFVARGDRVLITRDSSGSLVEKRDNVLPSALLRQARTEALATTQPEVLEVKQFAGEIQSTAVISGSTPYITTAIYRQSAGDFICQDGVVHIRADRYAGYSDGAQHNYSGAIEIGRLRDGSLVVGESTYSSATSMFVFREVRQTVSYIRFSPYISSSSK